MSRYPQSKSPAGQVNQDISKAIVAKMMEIYPDCQVKIKNLAIQYEQLEPPALNIAMKVEMEVVSLENTEDPD